MIKNKYPTIKPSLNLDFANTKSLDPRITFRRGTPGTYYDGVTHVKAEENLFDYSEDFSQWGYGRIVQTSGQSAPDGSSGAYKIEQASGQTNSGYLLQAYNTSANKSYTFSVYAKAGTSRNYIILRTYLSSNRFTYFDLVNGVIANDDERHIASISDAGNGWYRCSITYTPMSTSNVQFNLYFSDNNSSITVADDGGFIYLWGAQLEQRDSVTSYTATNGTPITKYQPKLMTAAADRARFDHDPITGESKGLLIEEQRTNLIDYSEDFDDDYWTHPRADVYEHAIAPDGTKSATELVANVSAAGGMSIYNLVNAWSLAAGSTTTHSCYLKKGDNNYNYAAIWVSNGAGSGANQYFDISNGTVESGATYGSVSFTIDDASIQDVGNGWFRCSLTITTDTTSVRSQFAPSVPTGDGSDTSCTIYETRGFLWGAQVEAGSFPTSYIKTTGASATRSADNASITGENFSSWYRQDEGSVGVDYNLYGIKANSTIFSLINPDSAQGYINLYCMGATNQQLNCRISNLSATAENMILENTATTGQHNVYVGYSDTNASSVIDSGDILESSISASFKADTLLIGRNTQPVVMNGHIKKIAYYPQRLTNEQLQNLTK